MKIKRGQIDQALPLARRAINSQAEAPRALAADYQENALGPKAAPATMPIGNDDAGLDRRGLLPPRPMESEIALGGQVPRSAETGVRPLNRSEIEPPRQDQTMAHERPFGESAETQEVRQRRHLEAPFFDILATQTALHSQVSPASREAEPTAEHLTKCEPRLLAEELIQLREQRRWGQWQLYGGSQNKHNDDLCIDIARANVLAQKNGYGLALPFLDANAPAEMNAELLDRYLLLLSKRPEPDQWVGRCTDLAAHYLVRTGWFEGVSLRWLGHLANKLNRYPKRTACVQAAAWIAGEVLKADKQPRVESKDLDTDATLWPPSTRRTASCLNSSV